MPEYSFSGNEKGALSLILLTVVFITIHQYRNRESDAIWSPLVTISAVFFYYLILGPVISIMQGNTITYTVDHRPYFQNAWNAGLLSLAGIILGFNLFPRSKPGKRIVKFLPDYDQVRKYGIFLFILGFAMFAVIAGSGLLYRLNFLEETTEILTGYEGAFRNYFLFGINFFIPASAFLLYAYLQKKGSLLLLIIAVFVAVALYASAGFRYRLVLLALSLLTTWYLSRKVKPNPIVLIAISIAFVTVMGILGISRNYGRGLDLTRIEDMSRYELFIAGLGESVTFQTTGLLIDQVPEIYDHIGWDPVFQSIVFPIPRRIWPEKPSGNYIRIINQLYLINNYLGIGAAVLNYGEYYLAFGWWGVIIGSVLLGWLAGKLWRWYRSNQDNHLVVLTFIVANSFLYVVISRGYLPQVVMNFFFTVFPCFVILWLHNRKARRLAVMRR